VSALSDRAEISELLDRYLTDFDTLLTQPFDHVPRDDAWYRRLFTEDLRLTFPVGGHQGIAGLAEFQLAAKANWARTQHISSNHVVDLDGDKAALRAQLLVTHVHPVELSRPHFTAGSRIQALAVRAQEGWRLDELTISLIWTSGAPPVR
jgi:hypothetical protein